MLCVKKRDAISCWVQRTPGRYQVKKILGMFFSLYFVKKAKFSVRIELKGSPNLINDRIFFLTHPLLLLWKLGTIYIKPIWFLIKRVITSLIVQDVTIVYMRVNKFCVLYFALFFVINFQVCWLYIFEMIVKC